MALLSLWSTPLRFLIGRSIDPEGRLWHAGELCARAGDRSAAASPPGSSAVQCGAECCRRAESHDDELNYEQADAVWREMFVLEVVSWDEVDKAQCQRGGGFRLPAGSGWLFTLRESDGGSQGSRITAVSGARVRGNLGGTGENEERRRKMGRLAGGPATGPSGETDRSCCSEARLWSIGGPPVARR
jgi:hypothetical protein